MKKNKINFNVTYNIPVFFFFFKKKKKKFNERFTLQMLFSLFYCINF